MNNTHKNRHKLLLFETDKKGVVQVLDLPRLTKSFVGSI
jgi:hypothetical protein